MRNQNQRLPWFDKLPEELRRSMTSYVWVTQNTSDPLSAVKSVMDWRSHGCIELMRLAIRDAREDGATWEDIGLALGMSRQQAHRTWARLIEESAPEE